MNYNEFYLHFYYSTNFTSVPFKCAAEKKKSANRLFLGKLPETSQSLL